MDKLKAVLRLLTASNYIVITDTTSDGAVSPLHAEDFMGKLRGEFDRQRLALHKHEAMMKRVSKSGFWEDGEV